MNKSASLSADGQFRYILRREWDDTKPVLTFVMLNPSTADADTDDATIRKCIGFAQREGFGSIQVTNLFSFRTRSPVVLKSMGYKGAEPIDDDHLRRILSTANSACGVICCAWGTKARWPVVGRRAKRVITMMKELGIKPKCLRILSDGIPSHPLMLSYSYTLKDFPI